jgi:AcrR family transcriptional regulator
LSRLQSAPSAEPARRRRVKRDADEPRDATEQSSVAILSPTKKTSWHHGNLRAEMIQRGTELLKLRGAADLSLRELARLAGVSQMAPTHHFGDKGGLFAAIATEGFHILMQMRLAGLKGGMTKEERLRVVMRTYVRFALERPELFHLMFGSHIANKPKYPELMEASTASFQFLSNSIAEFMSDHASLGRPPRFSAIVVWSGMHGLATLLSDRESGFCQVPSDLIDEVCDTAVSVLLSGIKNPLVHAATRGKRPRTIRKLSNSAH